MEHEQKHGINNGFLLGLVLGVVITLLLTTKRGRKIIKLLTEEGMEKFSELETLWEEATEKTPEEPRSFSVEENNQDDEEMLESQEEHVEKKEVKTQTKSTTEQRPQLHKRFFKGIHRRTIN